ncbi:hypothetical protein [Pseudescherichia sp.]|uniref:hypothetical protein n=1 Tax=Pseudescherichia sp. TaxID=2055881 RepID=UPI0028A07F5E|nr:hypothetical protein [Pseudescherichia sp.]
MSKMTFVVDFEDGKEPSVHKDMDVLGGKLSAVSFDDAFERIEDLENDLARMANE